VKKTPEKVFPVASKPFQSRGTDGGKKEEVAGGALINWVSVSKKGGGEKLIGIKWPGEILKIIGIPQK